jgi:hypothetical protein
MAAVEQVCQPMTYDSTLGKLPSNYDNAIYDCQGTATSSPHSVDRVRHG